MSYTQDEYIVDTDTPGFPRFNPTASARVGSPETKFRLEQLGVPAHMRPCWARGDPGIGFSTTYVPEGFRAGGAPAPDWQADRVLMFLIIIMVACVIVMLLSTRYQISKLRAQIKLLTGK